MACSRRVLPLVVKLSNTKTNTTDVFAFESSPVRIGRNKLNELHITDDVVSQWHGILRFGEGFVVFVDLGSTNGTAFNGSRLPRNTEVPVLADTILRIAHLELRFARVQVPPNSLTRKQSSFLSGPNDQSIAGARTVMFQVGAIQAPRADQADQRVLAEILQGTRPIYQQYTQALEQVVRYLDHYLEQVPADQRPAMVMALRQELPHFARTKEFRRIALKAGILPEQIGDVDVEAWIKRLVFGTDEALAARGLIDTHMALERIGAIMEAFSQAFVDLRGGHEQFLHDVGLRLNSEQSGLDGLRSSRAVLAYLLDWSANDQGRVDELNRAYADVAMHQVGLINGVVEGVRAILASLTPETIAGVPPTPRSSDIREARSAGLFGTKAKEWWKRYATKHAELEDGDRFARDIFGRAFHTAYLTIMGNLKR
jgi:type VI secretion system protein ImpI